MIERDGWIKGRSQRMGDQRMIDDEEVGGGERGRTLRRYMKTGEGALMVQRGGGGGCSG